MKICSVLNGSKQTLSRKSSTRLILPQVKYMLENDTGDREILKVYFCFLYNEKPIDIIKRAREYDIACVG